MPGGKTAWRNKSQDKYKSDLSNNQKCEKKQNRKTKIRKAQK